MRVAMTLLVLHSCASTVMSVWRKRVLSSAKILSTAALTLVKASSSTRTAKEIPHCGSSLRCHEGGHDLVGLAFLRLNSHVSLQEVCLEPRQHFVHGCLDLGEGIKLHAHCQEPRDSTLWFFFAAVMRVAMTLLVLHSCASTVMSLWRKWVLSSAKILSTAALTLVRASSSTRTAKEIPTLWFFFAAVMRVAMTFLGLAFLRLKSHVTLEEVGLELRQDF